MEILCKDLVKKGFLVRMMDSPHKTSATTNNSGENRSQFGQTFFIVSDSTDKKRRRRWPDRVVRVAQQYQSFDTATGAYFMVSYEGSKVLQRVMLVSAIIFSLVCCMFQIWPLWAKLWSWYLLVAFSTVMVSGRFLTFNSPEEHVSFVRFSLFHRIT